MLENLQNISFTKKSTNVLPPLEKASRTTIWTTISFLYSVHPTDSVTEKYSDNQCHTTYRKQ